jgi:hypothetical protein
VTSAEENGSPVLQTWLEAPFDGAERVIHDAIIVLTVSIGVDLEALRTRLAQAARGRAADHRGVGDV